MGVHPIQDADPDPTLLTYNDDNKINLRKIYKEKNNYQIRRLIEKKISDFLEFLFSWIFENTKDMLSLNECKEKKTFISVA